MSAPAATPTPAVPGEAGVRDLAQPVPLLRAARAVFDMSLDGMVWTRRSLLAAILLVLPAFLAILFRTAGDRIGALVTGYDLYGYLIALYYVRFILPLAALFYATALIADEVEGKTITYLLTRPVQRLAILIGKFGAYLATTASLSLPAVMVMFFLLMTARGWGGIGARVPDLFRDLGVMVLTLAAYGAFFALMGVVLRRPVIPGLLFLFVWELLANAPGYLPRFTITAYLRSLIRYRPPDEGMTELFGDVLPAALCLGTLGAMIVVFLAAAAWIFSSREYVLDQ